MKRNNRHLAVSLLVAFLALVLISPALAVDFRSGETVSVSGTKIKGPLFVSGTTLTVSADVDGDVFCAGQSITINGLVTGDVIGASNTLQINGPVQGDVRVAANTIAINGPVEGSVTAAANTISTGQNGLVKRDLMTFGNTVQVNGPVAGQVLGGGNQFTLNSPVGGDVRLWDVQNFNIGPSATVGGQIDYNSANEAKVEPGAKIGIINRLEPRVQPGQGTPAIPRAADKKFDLMGTLWSLAAGLLVWGIALWLVPRFLPRLGKTAREAPLGSFGWGVVTLLLVPLGVILLMITVIGIPLAMILMFCFIIGLMLSKVIASDALARAMTKSVKGGAKTSLLAAFLIVFAAIVLLSKLPVAGFFVSLIVACFALGIIVLTVYRQRPGYTEVSTAEIAATVPPVVPVPPPPASPPPPPAE
ncbi:MAG: hypothetical protein GYA42_08625 [Syntrophomonadaceae bacterium]|nr:hypothetical protein [Syntrophomonadaceae bacterium]